MTSKPSKKTNQKKSPAKKAPAKKTPASKKTSTPKDTDLLLSKVGEEKPQFVSAEKMMKNQKRIVAECLAGSVNPSSICLLHGRRRGKRNDRNN